MHAQKPNSYSSTPKRTLLANALAMALVAVTLSACTSKNSSPQPQDAARRDAISADRKSVV